MTPSSRGAPAPEAAPTPPPSADQLVRSVGGLAARLSELMIKESALLAAGQPADIAALQQEKADLARAYVGRWAQLKADPAGLAALPANLRQALRIQIERLTLVASENEQALRLMQNATDRVLGIVARAVREQRASTAGYTRASTRPKRIPGTTGITLDRRL
jgi:hypothetical protein